LKYDELIKSFEKSNLESVKIHDKNLTKVNGDYVLKGRDGHIDSLYYYNCSYPERLLQKYLKNYMLVEDTYKELLNVYFEFLKDVSLEYNTNLISSNFYKTTSLLINTDKIFKKSLKTIDYNEIDTKEIEKRYPK
jgi:hypothetical protein